MDFYEIECWKDLRNYSDTSIFPVCFNNFTTIADTGDTRSCEILEGNSLKVYPREKYFE
jgi:hypothetical protein